MNTVFLVFAVNVIIFFHIGITAEREAMAGILDKLRETKTVDVKCPSCGKGFGVKFNPAIDGSYCHSIKNGGTRIRGISTIHMGSKRNLKCPYCEHKFVEKREWL